MGDILNLVKGKRGGGEAKKPLRNIKMAPKEVANYLKTCSQSDAKSV